MIRWANLLKLLGFWILGLAASQLIAFLFGLAVQDRGMLPLGAAVLSTGILGGLLCLLIHSDLPELTHKEGILLVVLVWVNVTALGALPFWFSPEFGTFTDALFESVSGFTTTGASVLADVEALPPSLLFWRSFTHWLGGMGIILLMIAVLPLIGRGGVELYRAEFSGAHSEKLKPRIAETALALWKVYMFLSIVGYGALRIAGLGPLDALCQMFGALGTGGFSTRNGSIEAFANPTVEMVIVALMILGGINFTQHYRLLVQGQGAAFTRDSEIRWYLTLLAAASLILTVDLYRVSSVPLLEAGRLALFQVTSIMTATGFSTADFGQWSPFAQLLLLALMFAGGCTGSTAGGIKTARFVLLGRTVTREFRKMVERRGVFSIRFSGHSIAENVVDSLLNMVYLALLVNFAASLLLTATGVDVITAISAVSSCMFNVGPGLAGVGPAANYGHLSALAKWVLCFCMLAGRLEFYALLVLFTRSFWRK